MNEKNENLKELLSGLADAEEAAQMAEDIAAGDAIVDRFDSPRPDAAVVSGIKRQVAARLWLSKRRRFVRRTSEAVLAAVLVVGVLFGVMLMQNGQEPGVAINLGIWGEASEEKIAGDPEYALLVSEAEEIESSLLMIRLDENNDEEDVLFDIEMEVLEMNGNFWKG